MINYIMTYRQKKCRHLYTYILFGFSGPERKHKNQTIYFDQRIYMNYIDTRLKMVIFFLLESRMQFPDVWQKTWLLCHFQLQSFGQTVLFPVNADRVLCCSTVIYTTHFYLGG